MTTDIVRPTRMKSGRLPTYKESYSAPDFLDFLDHPLTVDDIPMESCDLSNIIEISRDTSSIPWENSIKDFILDLTSVSDTKKFSVCMLFTDVGYLYTIPTLLLLNKKHGSLTTILVHITLTDEKNDTFIATIRRDGKVEYCNRIEQKYIVAELLTWYVPSSTIVFCHTLSIVSYKELLGMMPETTWSLSCTLTDFVTCLDEAESCKYVCPVYAYAASMESRAVGKGPIVMEPYRFNTNYRGKMKYYFRCIRGRFF